MNVLMLAPLDREGGGVGTHWRNLAKYLKKKVKFLVLACDTKEEGYTKEDGVSVYRIPQTNRFLNLFALNPPSKGQISALLKKEKIDLIHIQLPLFSAGFELLEVSKDIPVVFTVHYPLNLKFGPLSTAYNIVFNKITKDVSSKSKFIITLTESYRKILLDLNIPNQKIRVIGNGVDYGFFRPGKSDMKKKLGCQKMVVYFGRLFYQKNVNELVRAFNRIGRSDTKLVIIGDGPERKKLESISNKYTVFTGYVDNKTLLKYLRAADVAVFPSRGESWGMTVTEAMSVGLPVVASRSGEIEEFLGAGRGLILDTDNPDELKGKLEMLLNNKKLSKEIGKKARDYIKKYSWKNISNEIYNLYKEAVKNERI
jgi:glycosyltransferase involved in cell wall biosynthesis